MSFLLDTNVVSEIRKPKPEANVLRWFDSVDDGELYLSVLVIGEIRQGVERLRRREPKRAGMYETWLGDLHLRYRDRIIPISSEIADEWGRMNVPDSVGVIDGLLAATAKVIGLTLVTRNTAHVARPGVAVLDPFAPRR